jgi:hypothetical protein
VVKHRIKLSGGIKWCACAEAKTVGPRRTAMSRLLSSHFCRQALGQSLTGSTAHLFSLQTEQHFRGWQEETRKGNKPDFLPSSYSRRILIPGPNYLLKLPSRGRLLLNFSVMHHNMNETISYACTHLSPLKQPSPFQHEERSSGEWRQLSSQRSKAINAVLSTYSLAAWLWAPTYIFPSRDLTYCSTFHARL